MKNNSAVGEKSVPENKKNQKKARLGINLIEIGLQFGLIIALPLIAFISLGLYLDKTYHTLPLFILLGLFLAIGLSTYILYLRISQIFASLSESSKK